MESMTYRRFPGEYLTIGRTLSGVSCQDSQAVMSASRLPEVRPDEFTEPILGAAGHKSIPKPIRFAVRSHFK
jgi:hypothetical protein